MAGFIDWRIVPTEYPNLWFKMTSHFADVHHAHCSRVNRNLTLMAEYYDTQNMFDLSWQLTQRTIVHDQSKMQEPEYVPYVWRVYRTQWNNDPKKDERSLLKGCFDDPTLDQAIRDAVNHHITHNRHHPEWHFDHDDMNKIDLTEMVCDWYAMSQEFKSSIDEWVAYVVPRRYHFGKRIPFIMTTVALLKDLDVSSRIRES